MFATIFLNVQWLTCLRAFPPTQQTTPRHSWSATGTSSHRNWPRSSEWIRVRYVLSLVRTKCKENQGGKLWTISPQTQEGLPSKECVQHFGKSDCLLFVVIGLVLHYLPLSTISSTFPRPVIMLDCQASDFLSPPRLHTDWLTRTQLLTQLNQSVRP